MIKRSLSIRMAARIYYLIMAIAVIILVIGKGQWLQNGTAASSAQWLFYGAIIVGILIIAPALVLLWFWLRRWMDRYNVERSIRNIMLAVAVPMLLVIGSMLELVFIMLFIGLGGD